MGLAEGRCDFTDCLADLIVWVRECAQVAHSSDPLFGCRLALDEVTVWSPRTVWSEVGTKIQRQDAVHKTGSFHHRGLASDLLLYRHGVYVVDGDDAAWKIIALKWEKMHPLAVSGRRFKDANHLSWGEAPKDGPLP